MIAPLVPRLSGVAARERCAQSAQMRPHPVTNWPLPSRREPSEPLAPAETSTHPPGQGRKPSLSTHRPRERRPLAA